MGNGSIPADDTPYDEAESKRRMNEGRKRQGRLPEQDEATDSESDDQPAQESVE